MIHPTAPLPPGLDPAAGGRHVQQRVTTASGAVTFVVLAADVQRICGPWADTNTPQTLAAGLEAFRRAVGHPWHSSAGRTTEAIIRATHPPAKGGTVLGVTPELPDVATDGTLEPAFMWHRPLNDTEAAAGWLHCYDANSQYLSAWQSVELGYGAPAYHHGPVEFDKRRVGLWHTELPARPVDPTLPNCWADGTRPAPWATTATLTRAAEILPQPPSISEAWLWAEKGRYLRPTAEALRDARTLLLDRPDAASAYALAAVKNLYRRGTGRLALTERDRRSGWPRPDWRLNIIALARVNFHRRLTKLSDHPFAVLVDAAYFAADQADPLRYAHTIGLPIGTGLGHYRPVATVALPPIAGRLHHAPSAAAVNKIVKQAHAAHATR
jgi:hypothetical protein